MSRELSRNERRLAVLAAFGVFWAAFLVTLGFRPLYVVILVGGLLGAAAVGLEGRRAAAALRAHARRVEVRPGGRDRVGRVGERAASAARELAGAARSRTVAAGSAALTAVEERARTVRRDLIVARRRSEALRLNEQAALFRQEGRYDQALESDERALEAFRALGDRRGEALTLNGIGLTQTRIGDETGALDSYETAAALLAELGDRHGAGRVLANLGVLHLGQGQDEQARAVWQAALERLEPGSPEHDRTANQLRQAG